jgi:NADPH:quinone reductase-like Zn-dependent oxidoreductase
MKETMKAIVQSTYGLPDVLEMHEVPIPVIDDDQVLIRVHASSVNALEWHLMTGTPYLVRPQAGFTKPKRPTLGADVAGTVEAAGANVTRFQPGDEVFGEVGGGYAEYAAARPETLALKPANATFEQAAAVPVAALTALQGLRDHGRIQSGQRLLINGASGGVGTFAIQIAKVLGAEVTAVCSTGNVDTARSLGADKVIDYTKTDFTESERSYDLMLDIVGTGSVSGCMSVLADAGRYVVVSGPKGRWLGPLPRLVKAKLAFTRGDRTMGFFVAKPNEKDMSVLAEWMESGTLVPMIETTYPLNKVPDALRRFGRGHARGKTVITF